MKSYRASLRARGRPFAMQTLGKGSLIMPPFHLSGRERISIGDRTIIYEESKICALAEYAGTTHNGSVCIGNDVYIGRYFYIGGAASRVTIDDDCVLSERVSIFDCSHGYDPEKGNIMRQPLTDVAPVTIGRGTFVGINVVVLAGVILGEKCIVGANAVVTKSFPAFSMIAGIPARIIKRYNIETKVWEPVA